jgi:hypothetical protein
MLVRLQQNRTFLSLNLALHRNLWAWFIGKNRYQSNLKDQEIKEGSFLQERLKGLTDTMGVSNSAKN